MDGVESDHPVVDPTQNVLDLVEAAVQRLDDLREAEAAHHREVSQIRAEHAKELRQIETDRLDAIRAVDVGAVQRAAEVQATQAGALAAQVVATADAFRVSLAAALEPIQKDIRDLRDAQSRTVGGRDQGSDTRTNISALIAAVGVALILVFGVLTVLAR
jgi:hypothetical protein